MMPYGDLNTQYAVVNGYDHSWYDNVITLKAVKPRVYHKYISDNYFKNIYGSFTTKTVDGVTTRVIGTLKGAKAVSKVFAKIPTEAKEATVVTTEAVADPVVKVNESSSKK